MKYKVGDIVLVSSPAGKVIPNIHVKLLKRVVVDPAKGNKTDGPGYKGWEATPVFQEEIDYIRKEWSIPFSKPGEDKTWVYDEHIVKRPRNAKPSVPQARKKIKRKRKTSKSGVTVIRKAKSSSKK